MARSRGVYNRIYTPELWEQVNQDNKDILEDWLAEYRQRKKAKGTIDMYYQNVRIVFIYILKKHKNKCILDMTKKDFRNMSLWLSEECNLSPNRVNTIQSTINSMLTFCEEDDDYNYEVNMSKKVKGLPRERVKVDEDNFFFTYDEFIKVRDRLVNEGELQIATMWSIAFDSAGRRNEVYQIEKHGLLDGNKTNVVRGKRGKLFPLVYLNDTKELIRQYLIQRGDDDIDSLWYKGSGDNKSTISKDTLYNWILKCSEILSEIRGEECHIFFHTCRHARIECLLQGEDDRLKNSEGTNRKYTLDEVMVMAHHSDVSTTLSYARNHDSDVIDDMFGFN